MDARTSPCKSRYYLMADLYVRIVVHYDERFHCVKKIHFIIYVPEATKANTVPVTEYPEKDLEDAIYN